MKNHISKILKLLLTIAILAYVFKRFQVDVRNLFQAVSSPLCLCLALLFPIAVLPLISSNRWKLFLHEVGVEESFWTLIKINLISVFQGLILPSSQGQDVLRIYYIEKRHPQYRGRSGSTIIIERMLGFIILCSICIIALFFIELPHKTTVFTIIGTIFILLLLVVTLLLNKKMNLYLQNKNIKWVGLNKMYSYVMKMYNTIAYFPYKEVLLSSIVLILMYQLSTIMVVYLVFMAYGIHLPLLTHIALYPIISILSMIPITISGLGIREGFFVYFYSLLGIPSDICVCVSLMNYMLVVLLPACMGCLIYVIDTFKSNMGK